jgi:hypothetical protein
VIDYNALECCDWRVFLSATVHVMIIMAERTCSCDVGVIEHDIDVETAGKPLLRVLRLPEV